MKKADWFIAIVFIAIGLVCMTISATSFMERPPAFFLRTLLTICVWIGFPSFILGSAYYVIQSMLNPKSKNNHNRN